MGIAGLRVEEPEAIGHWCRQEFSSIDLLDKRLDSRFIKTAEQLASNCGEPINQACGDWASAKGAYRLFGNPKLKPEVTLAAHHKQVRNRLKEQSLIFAIQDTTFLNFTAHPKTEGLGRIGSSKWNGQQGLVMHTTLGISNTGIPLGIIAQDIWARAPTNVQKKKLKEKLPIEEKESFKWIQSLIDMQSEFDTTKVVMICDREADIFEFISQAHAREVSFLIRAQNDRILGTNRNSNIPTFCLWEHMEKQPILGQTELEVSEKKDPYKTRTATLEVRASAVTLQAPGRGAGTKSSYRVSLSENCYAVWIREIGHEAGQEPIEWMLLTSFPVETLEEAIEKVHWYKMRWHIECYFKVLKSGCRIESCRLETAERLKNYITLFSIVAYRIYWMTHLSRQNPTSLATEVMQEHEWKALYCKIHKTSKLPNHPPTVNQAIRWIAQLGGFLARKGDGEPGTTTIWRGWQRLADISETWLLLNSQPTCG